MRKEVIKTTFQLRRGTASAFENNNPILAAGEPCYVIDEKKMKIGDGITPYRDLPYLFEGEITVDNGVIVVDTYSDLPVEGSEKFIYVVKNENMLYRYDNTYGVYIILDYGYSKQEFIKSIDLDETSATYMTYVDLQDNRHDLVTDVLYIINYANYCESYAVKVNDDGTEKCYLISTTSKDDIIDISDKIFDIKNQIGVEVDPPSDPQILPRLNKLEHQAIESQHSHKEVEDEGLAVVGIKKETEGGVLYYNLQTSELEDLIYDYSGPFGTPRTLHGKFDDTLGKLTAGSGIDITDNVISTTGSASALWEAGTGKDSVQTIITDPSWGKNNAAGDGAVAEGVSTSAHAFASHTEGYLTATEKDSVFDAQYAHAEGYKTTAGGAASHVEGDNTVANNTAEHAEGRYNKSNMGGTDATNTLHSVGIGSASMVTPGGDRKNAFEIMQNGDAYLYGVGDYDGANIDTAKTIQEVIDDISVVHMISVSLSEILADTTKRQQLWNTIKTDNADGKFIVIRNTDRDPYAQGGYYYTLVSAVSTTTGEIADATFACTIPEQGYKIGYFYLDKDLSYTYSWVQTIPVPGSGDVGKVLKVDAYSQPEWAVSEEGISDVKVAGTSVVTDGVATIPTASAAISGVVKADGSIGSRMETGALGVVDASEDNIKARKAYRANGYGVISTDNYDIAVKNALNVPTADGEYTLKCTVTGGVPTFTWETI